MEMNGCYFWRARKWRWNRERFGENGIGLKASTQIREIIRKCTAKLKFLYLGSGSNAEAFQMGC